MCRSELVKVIAEKMMAKLDVVPCKDLEKMHEEVDRRKVLWAVLTVYGVGRKLLRGYDDL